MPWPAAFPHIAARHALITPGNHVNSSVPGITGATATVYEYPTDSWKRVFDINGFGMLSFQAVLDRDVPLMMGILTIDVFLIMLGNILSDYLVASMDPRIRFD